MKFRHRQESSLPLDWPTCACGQMQVAPRTRTELAGVSHGETPCYHMPDMGEGPLVAQEITVGLGDELAGLVTHYGFDAVEAELGRIKIQMSGPVPAAPARDGDPRTSHAAAKDTPDVRRFGKNSYSGKLLRIFDNGPHTDFAATTSVLGPEAPVTKFEGCRRRCSDLRAAGYITDSGREEDGRIIWEITKQGEEALYRMILSGWSR